MSTGLDQLTGSTEAATGAAGPGTISTFASADGGSSTAPA